MDIGGETAHRRGKIGQFATNTDFGPHSGRKGANPVIPAGFVPSLPERGI